MKEDPLTAPVTCPNQLTDGESQVPVTFDPDCVRINLTCSVSLLDDTIVPFHVPAMFIVVPADTSDGATELPLHADTHAATHTISTTRIASSSSGAGKSRGDAIVAALRMRVKGQNRD